jgi:hypothetical protein
MKLLQSSVAVVVFVFAAAVFAGDAGCGLGSVVMKKNSRVSQTLAMTTNATFSSQFFGITTGTSNCNASGWVRNDIEIEKYIASNIHNIKVDMARGEGETLATLSLMMGCESNSMSNFGRATALEFSEIFPSEKTSGGEAYSNLKTQLLKYPSVAHACQLSTAG